MKSVEVRRRQVQMFSGALAIAVMFILGKYLNDMGLLFLAIAVECSTFFVILLSGQLSDVLGKLLRNRQGKRQYRNVSVIRRNVGIIQAVAGLIGSILLGLLAKPLSYSLFRVEYVFYPLLLISPVVFLRVITHVLLGYFQGEGNELPTSVVAVLRQILILVLGLSVCGRFTNKGLQVSELLKQDAYKYVYGAMGVALAIVLTELILAALLTTLFMFIRKGTASKHGDGLKATDSTGNVLRIVYRNRWSAVLLGLLTCLPLWACLIGGCISVDKGVFTIDALSLFYVRYLGIIGILAYLMLLLVLPLQAKAVQTLKNEGPRYASEAFNRGILYITSIIVFVVVYLTVLREHVAELFTRTDAAALSAYMKNGALLLLFIVPVYYFTRMLFVLGHRVLLLIVYGVTGLIFTVAVVLTGIKGGLSVTVLGIGLLLYALVLCIALGFLACKRFRAGLELLFPMLACVLAASVAGLIQMGLNTLFAPHLGGEVTLLVLFILTFIPYVLGLLLLRVFRENDFENLPGGRILLALGQMLHLY